MAKRARLTNIFFVCFKTMDPEILAEFFKPCPFLDFSMKPTGIAPNMQKLPRPFISTFDSGLTTAMMMSGPPIDVKIISDGSLANLDTLSETTEGTQRQ